MFTTGFVAVAVSIAGYVESRGAHRESSRGNFLEKHYKRFDAYRKGLGKSMSSVAQYVASDPALVTSLQTESDERDRVVKRATRALKRSTDPDLVLLVDADAHSVYSSHQLAAADLVSSRLLRDVLGGAVEHHEVAIFGSQVYQVSATPVRVTAQDSVVGALILGVRLERYLRDYQTQSDPKLRKQHRISLLGTDNRLLSSAFTTKEAKYDELAEALRNENWTKGPEGDGQVDLIHFSDRDYDFYSAELEGYDGNKYGKLGTMFLMRTRAHKQAEFAQRTLRTRNIFIAVLIMALLVGALLSWRITRRINRYVAATEDLAQGQGDLTKRLDARGSDQFGRLANNLNSVFAYVHNLAAKVQRAAFQVSASSAEISAASRQMLDGAQEQARKTEGSTAAVTELSSSIQSVADNALEATRVARSSGEAVQSAIERMNEIRATVEDAANRIQDLGESGKRIGNIVEVIRQISDQTTLLALNAAIEAAHAGEQGRGFAVVADEVSGLAKRVGQSARDIEDLIATIKHQTVEAVQAMEAGTSEVEIGTTLVTKTLNDLQKLVEVVADTAKQVQEQALASDEIARNMDVVQRIAQEVLSSSEEAVEQGEHLHRLAHTLEESVKGFRIDPAADLDTSAPALPAGDR